MNRRIEKRYSVQIFGMSLFSVDSQEIQCETVPKTDVELQSFSPVGGPVETEQAEALAGPSFVVNTLMLQDCFELLTQTEDENMVAVTGSCFDNVKCLERVVPVSLSAQSAVGVEAENESLADNLLRLNEFGLTPVGYFHSHPGFGIDATHPSGTDRQTQSLIEQSGSEILGAIFSRDKYVRFYCNSGDPNVRVIGKRIKEVEKNVYRLEAEEDVQE